MGRSIPVVGGGDSNRKTGQQGSPHSMLCCEGSPVIHLPGSWTQALYLRGNDFGNKVII